MRECRIPITMAFLLAGAVYIPIVPGGCYVSWCLNANI